MRRALVTLNSSLSLIGSKVSENKALERGVPGVCRLRFKLPLSFTEVLIEEFRELFRDNLSEIIGKLFSIFFLREIVLSWRLGISEHGGSSQS